MGALSPLRCLERARDVFGDLEGVVDGDRRFLYKDFAARPQRLAGALLSWGLHAGEPVAFLCRNRHELLEAYFGVPLAGGLILPLNVRLAPPELAAVLADSGARFLFYEQEFHAAVEPLAAERKVALGSEFETLLARSAEAPFELETLDENAPASLFYTSGSAGAMKGVVHSHRALYLHALSVALTFHIDDFTVELHTVPLFHANGWGRPHAAALMGARQVMLRRFDAREVYRLIEAERVTSLCLVPAMAQMLLEHALETDVRSVREIHLGGSRVSEALLERLEERFQCVCTAGYGMTETGPVAATGREKRGARVKQNGAFWPVPGARVHVAADGEVHLGGDHMMTGYWRGSSLSSGSLDTGSFSSGSLATGDLGVQDSTGLLRITGRRKEIVISGGENIAPSEVERVLERHPAVQECAVTGVADALWGEVLIAYVVRRAPVTAEVLRAWLVGQVAGFKIPRHWRFLMQPLPRSAAGKIHWVALKQVSKDTE